MIGILFLAKGHGQQRKGGLRGQLVQNNLRHRSRINRQGVPRTGSTAAKQLERRRGCVAVPDIQEAQHMAGVGGCHT